MAGSRLDRIGTIFSRTTGLLRSGAMKQQDRPVWYDVYRVFPPKYEPFIDREPSTRVDQVPNILYKEDKVRARFYKKFGLNPDSRPRRVGDPAFEDPSSTFVAKYDQLASNHPHWSFDQVFDAVAEEYESSRPQYQSQKRPRLGDGGGGVEGGDIRTQSVFEEEDSVSSEVLGRSPRKMTLVTAESLRALFEEAKSNQDGGNSSNKSKDGGKSEDK